MLVFYTDDSVNGGKTHVAGRMRKNCWGDILELAKGVAHSAQVEGLALDGSAERSTRETVGKTHDVGEATAGGSIPGCYFPSGTGSKVQVASWACAWGRWH